MREAKSNCDLRWIDSSFPYWQTLTEGRPVDRTHRRMDLVHRAKIFAPFNALEGYAELIREVNRSFDEPEPEKTEPNVCQFWEDP